MDDYDEFLKVNARNMTPMTPMTSPMAPVTTSQYYPIPPTGPMTPGYSSINPNMYMQNTPTMSQQSSFNMNIKCDIKQYPVFKGENAKWPKYKRDIIGMAATHGLGDVFDPNFSVPFPSDPDYNFYKEKNTFVYFIFISRVTGVMALSIICNFDATSDGR